MKKIILMFLCCLWTHGAWSQSGEGYDPSNPGDPEPLYTLTISVNPDKGGTAGNVKSTKLAEGQTYTIYPSPRLGYRFQYWAANDEYLTDRQNIRFVMPAYDVELTAYFVEEPYNPANPGDPETADYSHYVNVIASPKSGGYFSTSTSFKMDEGATQSIRAYVNQGFRFDGWKLNGELVSTDNPMTVTMGTEDLTYVAIFTYAPVSPDDPESLESTVRGDIDENGKVSVADVTLLLNIILGRAAKVPGADVDGDGDVDMDDATKLIDIILGKEQQ